MKMASKEVASMIRPEVVVEDALSRARTALANSPIFDLRELRVEMFRDALVISGTVSSFYHKQLAQEVVRTASDGTELVNTIHVQ